MKKKFGLMLICLLPVAMLVACRATGPKDLRFESVETVKLADLPGVWPAVQSRSDVRSDAITVLKINFSSQSDFVKLAKADALHFSYRAFICGTENVPATSLFVIPYLRIKNFFAGDGANSQTSDLGRFRDSRGRLTYHVLMPVASSELNRLREEDAVQREKPYFNPHAPRADICLRVIAAAMWFGPTRESNIVRIPASAVPRL